MKKQTALLLSTLVLLSAVSMQPAQAFKVKNLKFWAKKKPAVEAVKKEVIPVKTVAPKKEEAKTVPAVSKACPCAKPAAQPVAKKPCPCAKAPVKAPAKK